MKNYIKKPITTEDLDRSPIPINLLHYSKKHSLTIPENLTENDERKLADELKVIYDLITYVLSNISKRLHKYQKGDKNAAYFIESEWKTPIITWKTSTIANDACISFIFPESFTQEFIDSKEGKRFKNKKPCAYLFMRALQSQKTIMENISYVPGTE